MMWDARIDILDGGRVRRARILCDGKPVPYAEIIERWQTDSAFCSFFIDVLADAPYGAYLWETPPITRSSATRLFEFVLVDSPALAGLDPEPEAFADKLDAVDTGEDVAAFSNLGGDALLVAPRPRAPIAAYPHLAAFARLAPRPQQRVFWRTVGAEVASVLDDDPLWLSTCGLGVAWLHARLDSRPKYYTFQPYRSFS